MVPDGWAVKTLKDAGEAIIGLTYSPKDIVNSGGVEVLRSSNVQNGKIVLDDVVRVNAKIPEKILLRTGDILVCARNGSRSLIGKNARIDSRNTGKTFGAFMCVYRSSNPDYMYWVFQTESFRKQIARDLGPTINQVTTGNLNTFKFPFPNMNEQKRIVAVLKTWDEYLEKLDKKILIKEHIKKGLTLQLLTSKLRLPGFSSDWQTYSLNDICEFKKGAGLSKELLEPDGQNMCVLYGELYTKYDEIISQVISHTNAKEGVLSHKNDILIPASTTTSHLDLAIAASIQLDDVLLGGDINILRLKNKNLFNGDFLAYYLTHVKKHQLAKVAQGITIVHLYGRDLKSLSVNIPDINEQKAIVQVLMSADNELKLLTKTRNLLRQQKKFLANNLVSGKIRIPDESSVLSEVQYA